MKLNSGYIASALVHAGIVGVSLLAAFLAIPEVRQTTGGETIGCNYPLNPGVITLEPSSGSPAPRGAPGPATPPVRPVLNPVDPRKMLAEYENNLRAAEAAETARINALNTPKPSRVPVRPVTRPVSVRPSGENSGAAPVAKANSAAVPELTPVRVSVPGDGDGPAGIPGAPAGGSPGRVSTDRNNAFTQDVRAKFSQAYLPLFREKGAALAANSGAGTVKLFVSPSGVARFDGWKIRPGETLFEDIVKEAIAGMPAVLPPPGGGAVVVLLEVSGFVE